MNLFNLFATLTLDNSDYKKKLDDSQKSAGSFSSKIGTAFKAGAKVVTAFVTTVVAASTAIAGLAVKFINAGSEIDDNAQKLGISTDAYQYWSLVLQRAGTDAEQLTTAIRNMTTFTENLSAGQGDALLTLQKLGIGYEEFMAMDTESQLYAIVEALQGMENQTEKVTIAQDIFGSRVYQELLPLLNMEQGSLEELRDEFEKLNIILDEETIKRIAEVGDKIDNLSNLFKVNALIIASNLLPEIELITEGLIGLANGSDDAMQSLTDGLVGLINKVAKALPSIIDTAGDLLLQLIVGLADVLSDPEIIQALVDVLEALLFKVVEILPTLTQALFDIVAALFEGILKIDWGTFIIDLLNALIEIFYVQVPALFSTVLMDILDLVFDLFTTKKGLESLKEFGISLAKTMINGLKTGIENGVNVVINAVNKVLGGISKAWSWAGIPEIPDIPPLEIPDFAEGGMFNGLGTIYLARAGEAGAEIVAHGSRGTGVANVEQIADAQYMAMNDYGLKEAINAAAAGIVNGIVTGLRMSGIGGVDNNVVVKIGEKEFKSYIVESTNNSLKAQGRKSLKTVTAY